MKYVERYKPRLLTPPGRQPRPTTPPQPGPPRNTQVRLLALLWATWDQAHPTDYTALSIGTATRGYNWAMWENALLARIAARGGNPAVELVKAGQLVQLHGEAVLDLASMMDVVFFGHWIPKGMVQAIKARSTAPQGTQVYFWGEFESQTANVPWEPHRGTVRQAISGAAGEYVLVPEGGEANNYGEPLVDKYEVPWVVGEVACPHTPSHGLPPGASGGPHGWDVDVYALTGSGVATSARALQTVRVYQDLLDQDWTEAGKHVVDGFAFDNALTYPYKGTATVDYPAGWPERYIAGQRAFMDAWHGAAAANSKVLDPLRCLWGNSEGGVQVPYPTETLRQRYWEHFFRMPNMAPATWVYLQQRLQDIATSGQYCALAFNGTVGTQYYWGATPGGWQPATTGTWADVVAEMRRLGLMDRCYVAVWQTLQDAYAFWQEGFREPS